MSRIPAARLFRALATRGMRKSRPLRPALPAPPSRTWPMAVACAGAAAAGAMTLNHARCVATSPNATAPTIKLYQYEICPFSNKVKALCDWAGLDYTTVDVVPARKPQLAFSQDYRKVPIAIIDGVQVNDSPVIIEHLLRICQERGLLSADQVAQLGATDPAVTEWVQWVDSRLALVLYPCITRDAAHTREAFQYAHDVPTFSWADKAFVAYVPALVFPLIGVNKRLSKKYGIDDFPAALESALNEWETKVAETPGAFHGGERVNLADLMAYGSLRAIEHTRTVQDALRQRPAMRAWYEACQDQVGASHRIGRVGE